MKKIFFAILISLLIISCTPTDNAKDIGKREMKEEVNPKSSFAPPADGKITEEQIGKYINVAKELTTEIENMSKKVEEFKKKYNLTEDDMENLDKKDEKIRKEFESIKSNWENIEQSIYKKYNISQDEFEWIAAALTDSVNSEIQKRVEKELSVK
ncbi:MAG: hypothetical protein QME48_07875 [bacterium]|nr:hypothetical protein [bacterium]